tara:strand:+ start:77 stop:331 length:255 start_codon:yes stop_codon:yes gene_type:complete
MKRKRKKYTPLAQKIVSDTIVEPRLQTLEERIEYVESITKNDTCHRPDISCYDVCDSCPLTEYCLCSLNTKNNKKRYKRMIKLA